MFRHLESMQNTIKAVTVVAALSVAATIPVWMPRFPPMTDLPQHAAQIALVRELLRPGYPFASLFEVNWFTPYLVGYALVYALASLTGMVIACKAVVALAIAAVPIATALLLVETGGDPLLAVLTIPAMYGFDYQWGFLNFIVAAPLGLFVLLLAFRFARVATFARGAQLAAGMYLLFFCHAMTAVVFGAAAGLILLMTAGDLRSAIRRLMPLAVVAVVMALWGLRATHNPDTQWPIDWDLGWLRSHQDYYASAALSAAADGLGWGRLTGIFPYVFGVRPGLVSYGAGAVVVLLPLAAGGRFSRQFAAWMPLATLIAVLLFAPSAIFGADFVFQRFSIFFLPLYLTAIESRRRPPARAVSIVCILFAAAWIVAVGVRTRAYEREAAGFDEVLARMQPGERVLSLPFERDSAVSITPTFLHYPAWYSGLRGGVVDPSFAVHSVELVRYTDEEDAGIRLWGFEFNPDGFDWNYFEGWKFRYFVARAKTNPFARIFSDVRCRIQLRVHAGDWWLYERDPGCHE